MIGYALGCLTVGVVWFFWPKLREWASGEQAKLQRSLAGVERDLCPALSEPDDQPGVEVRRHPRR